MNNYELSPVGHVNSIQTLGTLDGPGVRFVVFLQGCNLRCACCHNPETWRFTAGKPLSEDDKQEIKLFTAEELAAIDKIRKELGTTFCRRCGYCAPCSVGINIPNMFVFHGYLSRYGLQDWAKDRYAAMPAKAGNCVECGACEERCPYQLPIRSMLKKVAEDFGA